MPLPRPSIVVRFTRLLASAALLLAGLAAPVSASHVSAAPISAGPISAAHVSAGPPPLCGVGALVVTNGFNNGPGSLRAAVACALNGQTVTFSNTQTGNAIVLNSEIPITQSITIDGSGAPGVAADGAGASRVFNISANGPVTLTHLIIQNGYAASGNGGALLAGSPLLVLNQVQVLSSTAAAGTGGGLYSGAGAIFTNTQFISNTSQSNAGGAWVNDNALVTGGRFERNTCAGAACQGGGLNVDGLTLSGTQFISNSAAGQGGGVWANSAARLTIASFQGNRCTDSACLGGGLYGVASLTLTNTDFISNTASGNGGGAWAAGAATLTGGHFQGNTCSADPCQGGGLLANSSLTLSGTQFSSNQSTAGGGGAWTNSTATLTNGSFQANGCSVDPCPGGGLYVSATLTLSGTQFNSNNSRGQGAGAWVGGAAQAAGGHFEDNHCIGGCRGGGLYASAGLTLTQTDFINNSSAQSGGGAFVGGAASISGGSFQDNHCYVTAICKGAGLHVSAGLTLTLTDFINNRSTGHGGGLFAGGPASIRSARFQGNQCTDSSAGGCRGGGLYANDALTLTNTDFLTNTSLGYGGAVWASGIAQVTGGNFQDNTCTGSNCKGGGLNARAALTMTGTSFIHNTSLSYGGGAYAFGAAVVSNGLFQDNHCTESACYGGGLLASDALTLTSTNFYSNTSRLGGGGLWVGSGVTVTHAHFENNACAAAGCEGGGLYGSDSVTLTDTQFISNTSGRGGGVWAGGAVSISNARFERNTCTNPIYCFGGGLATYGALTISNAQFVNNASQGDGGGVAAIAEVVLTDTVFQDNACTVANCLGGALLANYSATVLNSSFNGNQSTGSGGGIGLAGNAVITLANVTLADNIALVSGGGLYAGGGSTAQLWNLTITDNQAPTGGGLRVEAGATAGVTNTIFSNNTTGNCSGAIAASTHNLQFPAASCGGAGFTTADPLLGPLALNAPGATFTRALLAGSPARDHGDPASCANALVNNRDQRGVARPADGDNVPGAVCDIGSYEAALFLQLFLPLVRRQ